MAFHSLQSSLGQLAVAAHSHLRDVSFGKLIVKVPAQKGRHWPHRKHYHHLHFTDGQVRLRGCYLLTQCPVVILWQ